MNNYNQINHVNNNKMFKNVLINGGGMITYMWLNEKWKILPKPIVSKPRGMNMIWLAPI